MEETEAAKATRQSILITGASSGFGALTARALARAGHVVYASMRDLTGRNTKAAESAQAFSREHSVTLLPVELDVGDEASAQAAVATVLREQGRLDVLLHNAGHMVLGASEAFTPAQLAAQYDVNVLGTQRVNRAALPIMRQQRRGLLVWVGSSSTRGGAPPYLGPYFAAKAAMDALAVCYAGELARWGIETTIIVPGAFTSGTNHFAHAGSPADRERQRAYDEGPYGGLAEQLAAGLGRIIPADADAEEVARAIADVVARPFGKRPFRVHVDPGHDGAEEVNGVADRVRREIFRRLELTDLLSPHELP